MDRTDASWTTVCRSDVRVPANDRSPFHLQLNRITRAARLLLDVRAAGGTGGCVWAALRGFRLRRPLTAGRFDISTVDSGGERDSRAAPKPAVLMH